MPCNSRRVGFDTELALASTKAAIQGLIKATSKKMGFSHSAQIHGALARNYKLLLLFDVSEMLGNSSFKHVPMSPL